MRKGWLPESLTRRVRRQTFCTAFAGVAGITPDGGRLQFGTVAGIKSESRPGIKRPADSYSAALTMDVGTLEPFTRLNAVRPEAPADAVSYKKMRQWVRECLGASPQGARPLFFTTLLSGNT
jgi:hypothetical protein